MIKIRELVYWYIRRPAHRVLIWLVMHFPKSIAYWSAIRVGAHATTGEYSNQIVPELTFTEALNRWEKR